MASAIKLDPLVIANVPPEIMYKTWLEWKDSLSYVFDALGINTSKKKFSTMMAYAGLELQRLYKKLPKPVAVPGKTEVYLTFEEHLTI